MSKKYDQALKLLFSYPEMIASLVKTFVPGKWVNDLDFSTLSPLKNEHISEYLNERRNDLVWKIRTQKGWLYLLLLLEFQSSNDDYMALRVLTYSGLIYQDVIKHQGIDLPNGKLPPLLPVVFYTGEATWRAPDNFRDCLSGHIPNRLLDFQLDSKYLLLDVGRLPLMGANNIVLSLIELERARTVEEIHNAIKTAKDNLKGKADSLKRAFIIYSMKALKIQERFPNVKLDELSEFSMLYERADQIWEDFERRKYQEGKLEGKLEGRHEERRNLTVELLIKSLQKKCNVVLPSSLRAKLEQASTEQLTEWLDQIIEERLDLEAILTFFC